MEIIKTNFEGLFILKPQRFYDERGFFCETYHKQKLESIIGYEFVQDNESLSRKNVIRGMHFQIPPFEQGKLVRVIVGAIYDVVVDLRKNSENYGKYFSIVLSSENNLQLWIPPGFAHGFLSLENNTLVSYKCTQFYNKDYERSILWNDEDLSIDWKVDNPIVSLKDQNAMRFKDFISPF